MRTVATLTNRILELKGQVPKTSHDKCPGQSATYPFFVFSENTNFVQKIHYRKTIYHIISSYTEHSVIQEGILLLLYFTLAYFNK